MRKDKLGIWFSLFLAVFLLMFMGRIAFADDNPRAVFYQLSTKQLLGLMVAAESRENSSIEGRNAIASVALERNDYYGWGLKKIILHPKWFSSFNPDNQNFPKVRSIALNFRAALKKQKSLQESYLVADMLMKGTLPRHKVIVEYGVMHYAAIHVKNNWTRKMTVVMVKDGHNFYAANGVTKNILPIENYEMIGFYLKEVADRNKLIKLT